MMQSVQNNYPAIKSIVWFNTNKELDWALNLSGNTGLNEYNDSVSTDYFSGKLQIKSQPAVEPVEEPVVEPVEEEVVVEAPTTKTKGKSGNKKKTDSLRIASTEADTETAPVTGIAKAMAVSKMPTVVGERLLAREAEGLRNMPKAELSKWRLGRVLGE